MITTLKLRHYQFIRKDLSSAKFWIRKFQILLKFTYFVRRGLVEKYCLQRAAGMAYASMLAMVPTLAVFLSVFSSVKYFPPELKQKIEVWIFQNFIPETSQKLSEQIGAHVQGFANSALTIGMIGTLFMVVSVFFLLSTIEYTFNSTMQVEKERTFLHKLSAYTNLLVWAPLLIGLSLYFASQTDITVHLPFIHKINTFFRYGLVILAFTFAYKIIPNIEISTKCAFYGGIVGAGLWELARHGFSYFASTMVTYDKIYGALGIIPLFLIWLYLVWIVVLVGIEVTFVSKNIHILDSKFKPLVGPDAYALKILERVGRCYLNGESFENRESLLKNLKLTEPQLDRLLGVLTKSKVLVPLPSEGQLTLARAPEKINLWSVVSLFHPTVEVQNEGEKTSVRYGPLGIQFSPESANLNLRKWIEEGNGS